ncbi:MAG: hypothetical protein HRU19_21905 [Pseudobacteriovorax sp.]|nr:hypothetical protein [Pseudobacteriovorax sp.]
MHKLKIKEKIVGKLVVPGRGQSSETARQQRIAFVENDLSTTISSIAQMSLESKSLSGNIENQIGSLEVPVGLAGPLKIEGSFWNDTIFAPFATTE